MVNRDVQDQAVESRDDEIERLEYELAEARLLMNVWRDNSVKLKKKWAKTEVQLDEGRIARDEAGYVGFDIPGVIRALTEDLKTAEGKIRAVDALLARRPKLDGFVNRIDKIQFAINAAQKAEDDLYEVNRTLEMYRERVND